MIEELFVIVATGLILLIFASIILGISGVFTRIARKMNAENAYKKGVKIVVVTIRLLVIIAGTIFWGWFCWFVYTMGEPLWASIMLSFCLVGLWIAKGSLKLLMSVWKANS